MQIIYQRAIAYGLLALASIVIGASGHMQTVPPIEALLWTMGSVLLASGLLVLLASFDRGRTHAWLRLDWFVPSLRKRTGGYPIAHSLLGRIFRRVAPASLQSNHGTKQRGPVRVWLRRLGLSWLSSPVRRGVQGVCLMLFLGLFFVVCWPYSAHPPEHGRMSTGWVFVGLDQATGEFELRSSGSPSSVEHDIDDTAGAVGEPWMPRTGDRVFVFNAAIADAVEAKIGQFTLAHMDGSHAKLLSIEELTPELMNAFLIGSSKFDLSETDIAAWPSHYADNLISKEFVPAEIFLVIDPLVSLSTAIASRSWVWSLLCAAIILVVCVLIPRGFCGYLCPLGTTIDLFDWAIAGRFKRFRVADDGWWVHIKYYLLAGTLIAALGGVLVSGFVSAIPVITRALLFVVDPLQNGVARGWHLVPALNLGHALSIGMFALVLGLGFLRPRFWCKYVCPSGAVFSLGNLLRVTERKVESSCINCNKCVEICPFDAIKPDFTTRTTDCTLCQSCGGVCPTHAIKFVERWNVVELKIAGVPPTNETPLGRRGFLSLAAGTSAAVIGGTSLAAATKVFGANLDDSTAPRPVRPPGSVPEQEFLQMCIRCGECFKACPNNVLQPEGFLQGLEGLWTPYANTNWAGCESSCNACGQVCPTGAIRALPLEEKRVARMGLAIVNETTCLPYAGKEACDLCVQECNAAGYHAIEYTQVGTHMDDHGLPIEGSGFLAPVVLDDKCVGCGLCQTRCFAINVKNKHLLEASAIIVEAGSGKEDRLMHGSYLELRISEQVATSQDADDTSDSFYVPEINSPDLPTESQRQFEDDDPFGIGPTH